MSMFFTADLCKNKFIGIDSFEGVSEPSKFDSDYFKKYDLKAPYDVAKNNLSRYSNVNLIKGWIPEILSDLENSKYSLVHIDVDLYEPTLRSIEYFWEKMISGGILVCDDYGSSKTVGARKAVDDFFGKEKIIELTTGQSIIIKI